MGRSLSDLIANLNANTLQDQDIDSDDLTIQKKRREIENRRYEEDTRSRKILAYWAAWVVSIYILLVLAILVFNNNYVCLSDSVLSILLGTTTFNVLGLMYIVLKGYFKS